MFINRPHINVYGKNKTNLDHKINIETSSSTFQDFQNDTLAVNLPIDTSYLASKSQFQQNDISKRVETPNDLIKFQNLHISDE